MPLRLPLPSAPSTSGVFRERHCRIVWESYTLWSGSSVPTLLGKMRVQNGMFPADFSHYFCKKCDCKSLHWAFKDKRNCDQCGHKPMDHVCFWVSYCAPFTS